MPSKLRGFLVAAILALVAALTMLFAWLSGTQTTPTALTPNMSRYDPTYYGLPDELGVFRVFAVLNADNIPCFGGATPHLMLQIRVESEVLADYQEGETWAALEALDGEWELQFVGPGFTEAHFQQWIDGLYSTVRQGGCPTPAPQRTSPLPRNSNASQWSASYYPSYYGLPDVIGGYRTIMVLTSENQPCMPEGTKQLTVAMIEADAETASQFIPIRALMAELERYAGGGWDPSVQVIMNAQHPIVIENLIVHAHQRNSYHVEGICPRLGGPIGDEADTVLSPESGANSIGVPPTQDFD